MLLHWLLAIVIRLRGRLKGRLRGRHYVRGRLAVNNGRRRKTETIALFFVLKVVAVAVAAAIDELFAGIGGGVKVPPSKRGATGTRSAKWLLASIRVGGAWGSAGCFFGWFHALMHFSALSFWGERFADLCDVQELTFFLELNRTTFLDL